MRVYSKGRTWEVAAAMHDVSAVKIADTATVWATRVSEWASTAIMGAVAASVLDVVATKEAIIGTIRSRIASMRA